MVADVALVSASRQRGLEDAHFKGGVFLEDRDFPRTGGVNGGLAAGEQHLRVGVFHRLETFGQERRPLGQLGPGVNIRLVGVLAAAIEQRLAAFFALPVVGADVLEAHRGGFPQVGGTHGHRDVGAFVLQGLQRSEELFFGRGRLFDAGVFEGFLVIEETVNDRSHRDAENVLAVVGDPGALGHVVEVGHAGQVIQGRQVALVVQGQRSIERAAGDQVAGRTAFQLGVQHAVVLSRGGRGKGDFDVGVLGIESRDDRIFPDLQVIIAPAFDGQGDFLAAGGRGLLGFGWFLRGLGSLGRGRGGAAGDQHRDQNQQGQKLKRTHFLLLHPSYLE